jgi:hypothetical protein
MKKKRRGGEWKKKKRTKNLLKDNKNQLTNWIQTSMTNPSRTLHFPKA